MTEKQLWASKLKERINDIAIRLQVAISHDDVALVINDFEEIITLETTNADLQIAEYASSINDAIKNIRSDLNWPKLIHLISLFMLLNSHLDFIIKSEDKKGTAETLEKIFLVLAKNSAIISDVINLDEIFKL